MPVLKEDWKAKSRRLILDHEIKEFKEAFKNNFFTLIISSFGLLTALTWNNFWNAWISSLSSENALPYKFLVAFGITILAVIMTYAFSRLRGSKS